MEARADTNARVAAILNAWWMVRHYERGGRSSIQNPQWEQAIQKLGLTVREAFNKSNDFKPLLAAVVDGASRHSEPPF